jgi:hypothetical protein
MDEFRVSVNICTLMLFLCHFNLAYLDAITPLYKANTDITFEHMRLGRSYVMLFCQFLFPSCSTWLVSMSWTFFTGLVDHTLLDMSHSVELLWTNNQPDAENST